MTKQAFNIDREFVKFFYEEHFPTNEHNRAGVMAKASLSNVDQRDYWMREAFLAGAKAMAAETSSTLGEWSASSEGCRPKPMSPDEMFASVKAGLDMYYSTIKVISCKD